MSEQVVSALASGTGPATITNAKPGIGAEVVGGNVAHSVGKLLPEAVPVESAQDLGIVVELLNFTNPTIGRDLRFQVDLDKGYAVIQVLDRETGELIREIPPDKASPYVAANGALEMRLYDELV